MLRKSVVAVVISMALLVSIVELACVAGERGGAGAPRASLFTEGVEPELPIASEVDPGELAGPTVTR
ncbi:MAG: hypothetical protein HY727_09260 [Candidatus Rokubacteria bacterium]|nr:hypothetical protein [Candidatus Rokubacteria bacterium]